MINRAQRQPETAKARDRMGETYGPYTVTRPVGDNPLTSLYWRATCSLGCGYEVTKNTNALQTAKKQKLCGCCRGTGVAF